MQPIIIVLKMLVTLFMIVRTKSLVITHCSLLITRNTNMHPKLGMNNFFIMKFKLITKHIFRSLNLKKELCTTLQYSRDYMYMYIDD